MYVIEKNIFIPQILLYIVLRTLAERREVRLCTHTGRIAHVLMSTFKPGLMTSHDPVSWSKYRHEGD